MKNVWTFIGIVLIIILVFVLLVGGLGMMAFSGFGARGMMGRLGGVGMMGGLHPLGWIVSIVFWLLVIGGIVALVVWLARNGGRILTAPAAPLPSANATPLDILKTRYAKGEISKEQYEAMKQDLA